MGENIGLVMIMKHPVNLRENSSISWTLLELLFGLLILMITEEIMEQNSLSCMPSTKVWNLVKRMILRIQLAQDQLQCVILLKQLLQNQLLPLLTILDLMNAQKT